MFSSLKSILALTSLLVELLKGLRIVFVELYKFIIKKRREKEIDKAVDKAKSSKDTSDIERLLNP